MKKDNLAILDIRHSTKPEYFLPDKNGESFVYIKNTTDKNINCEGIIFSFSKGNNNTISPEVPTGSVSSGSGWEFEDDERLVNDRVEIYLIVSDSHPAFIRPEQEIVVKIEYRNIVKCRGKKTFSINYHCFFDGDNEKERNKELPVYIGSYFKNLLVMEGQGKKSKFPRLLLTRAELLKAELVWTGDASQYTLYMNGSPGLDLGQHNSFLFSDFITEQSAVDGVKRELPNKSFIIIVEAVWYKNKNNVIEKREFLNYHVSIKDPVVSVATINMEPTSKSTATM